MTAALDAPAEVLGCWPKPLGETARIGLAGEFVSLIEPHSEADPAGLLFSFLAGVGVEFGRSRYFIADGARHHAHHFVALVGETCARKGTASSHSERELAATDETFRDRVATGLSSGEGLIARVRDPVGDQEGTPEKRLLVIEPELGGTIRVMSRDGNSLSAILRRAWDGDVLSVLTRKDPLQASDAHIGIVGHVTRDELLKALPETERLNGWANRLTWVSVKRSRILPEGGRLDTAALADFRQRLRAAIDDARQDCGEVTRDDAAREVWLEEYRELTTPPPGILGAILSRAAPQVMRFALTYALLDRSAWITLEHLKAGLECWRYASASAEFIFGDLTGDPRADRVMRVLAERGGELARSDVVRAFANHLSGEVLDDVRDALLDLGAITTRRVGTNGRPREVWALAENRE